MALAKSVGRSNQSSASAEVNELTYCRVVAALQENVEICERTSGLENSKSYKNSPLMYSCAAGAYREVLKGTRAELCEVVVSAVDLAGAEGGCVLD